MDKNASICFVITGFGIKIDYETGKSYAFKKLIQSVFTSLDMCFRTIEPNYSGSIEKKISGYILKANFVVADLSSLNPNALYAPGVCHALKPYRDHDRNLRCLEIRQSSDQ